MENATVDIGTRLRELREEKGLSVEEIAQNIKVPAKILFRIEAGQLDNLPHPVYARSFIKTYGQALGMDSEELNARLDSLFDIKQEIEPSSVYTPVEEPSPSWKGPLLVVILACIVAGAAWLLYDNVLRRVELGPITENLMNRGEALISGAGKDDQKDASVEFSQAPSNMTASRSVPDSDEAKAEIADETETDAALERSDPRPEMGPVPETPASLSSANAPMAEVPATADDPFGANRPITNASSIMRPGTEQPALSSEPETVEPAEPLKNESAAEPAPKPAGARHEVTVSATAADCWIRVTGPGMEKKDVMLRKGQSVTLPYSQEMTMRLGNIFGVAITHDGREVPFSKDGAPVRTLNFPL